MNKLLLMAGGKRKPQFAYQVSVTAGQATTPKFTFGAGAPAAVVDWGDGSARTAVVSGTELNHAYAANGTYTVRLIAPQQEKYLTQIDINSDKVTGSVWARDIRRLKALQEFRGFINSGMTGGFRLSDLPASMTTLYLYSTSSVVTGSLSDLPANMVTLHLGSTTSSVITGSLSDLPANMVTLYLYLTSSVITGSLSDLPANMTTLYLHSTSSVVTGSLSDLPTSMVNLHLYSTSSVITGGAPKAAIRTVEIQSTGMLQAAVDAVLLAIYAARATYTYATPALNIGGTNQAPTGTYEDEDPVVSGKGAAYELVNDPETEGFKKWTITFTV